MRTRKNNRSQKGATLIEVAITILVLVIVMAAVFAQIDSVSQSTKRESMTMDMTQENRDFVDLFARDVHMSGYPVSEMYASSPSSTCVAPGILPSCSKSVAVGIVYASSTRLVLEGDVYGDGTLYSVQYRYYQTDPNTPPDPNCPCLRRSAMPKVDRDPLDQTSPIYYTEIQNVLDPGSLNEAIFTYYDAKGNLVDVTGGKDFESNLATIQQIDAIKVNLHVQSTQKDPQTNQQIVNSLSSVAELEN